MLPTKATSGVALVVLALTAFAAFSMGAASGANAATNESVELENTTQELEQVPGDLKENVSENATGARKQIILSTAVPAAHAAVYSAKVGISVGYASPPLGRFISNVGPLLIFGAILAYYVRLFKRLWDKHKRTA